MVKLIAKSPAHGMLPIEIGTVRVEECEAPMASLSAYQGQEAALDAAMQAAHGVGLPKVGGTSQQGELRCQWFGLNHVLLIGAQPDAALAAHAAITDQSDAWCRVRIEGQAARDVLGRLVPVDLRDQAVPVGATMRTDVRHMSGSLTRVEETTWEVMVFRSMAGTLVHDLKAAMRTIADLAELRGT